MDLNQEFIGIVVDSNDPDILGRCKLRVYGVFDDLQDEELPWAFPYGMSVFAGGQSKGAGAFSVPKVGTKVRVSFMNGDIHSPVWHGVHHLNDDMRNSIKETYQDSHVLVYDEDQNMKIWFTPGNGIQIFWGDSSISINPDKSILIDHKESKSNIELKEGNIIVNAVTKVEVNSPKVHVNGGRTELGTAPEFSVILGEVLMAALDSLALTVDLKWPPSPGVSAAIMQQARTALSNTVKTTA